jgi:Cys-tRNA(Pro)/Cys-tRNA(Cys) deacylase
MCIQWIGMIARNKEQRVVKTNAVRVLDRLAIKYELREYEVDPQDLSAEAVAAKIRLPPEQLFKTLAVRGARNGIYLAVISGNDELDFKALAHHTGDRKVEMVPLKEVQEATGYIRGGVTALACKKNYPVYMDELAQIFDTQHIFSTQLRDATVDFSHGTYWHEVQIGSTDDRFYIRPKNTTSFPRDCSFRASAVIGFRCPVTGILTKPNFILTLPAGRLDGPRQSSD